MTGKYKKGWGIERDELAGWRRRTLLDQSEELFSSLPNIKRNWEGLITPRSVTILTVGARLGAVFEAQRDIGPSPH